jgi:fatty acid desaturase
MAARNATTSPDVATGLKVLDLVRPLVFLGAFVAVERYVGWMASVPFAVASVLAASVLVHDLIHNALALPTRANDWLLAFFALFLLKSGHALRRLHLEHHARCLEDDDREGNVVFIATWKLLLTGPWLALQARGLSWAAERRARGWQAVETILDVALTAALVGGFLVTGRPASLVYLGTVVAITVTVPILGAKVPHLLPERCPRLVRFLRPFAGRLTPAASSLLFHELHHRRPKLPAALLPENAPVLEALDPSNCAEKQAERQT